MQSSRQQFAVRQQASRPQQISGSVVKGSHVTPAQPSASSEIESWLLRGRPESLDSSSFSSLGPLSDIMLPASGAAPSSGASSSGAAPGSWTDIPPWSSLAESFGGMSTRPGRPAFSPIASRFGGSTKRPSFSKLAAKLGGTLIQPSSGQYWVVKSPGGTPWYFTSKSAADKATASYKFYTVKGRSGTPYYFGSEAGARGAASEWSLAGEVWSVGEPIRTPGRRGSTDETFYFRSQAGARSAAAKFGGIMSSDVAAFNKQLKSLNGLLSTSHFGPTTQSLVSQLLAESSQLRRYVSGTGNAGLQAIGNILPAMRSYSTGITQLNSLLKAGSLEAAQAALPALVSLRNQLVNAGYLKSGQAGLTRLGSILGQEIPFQRQVTRFNALLKQGAYGEAAAMAASLVSAARSLQQAGAMSQAAVDGLVQWQYRNLPILRQFKQELGIVQDYISQGDYGLAASFLTEPISTEQSLERWGLVSPRGLGLRSLQAQLQRKAAPPSGWLGGLFGNIEGAVVGAVETGVHDVEALPGFSRIESVFGQTVHDVQSALPGIEAGIAGLLSPVVGGTSRQAADALDVLSGLAGSPASVKAGKAVEAAAGVVPYAAGQPTGQALHEIQAGAQAVQGALVDSLEGLATGSEALGELAGSAVQGHPLSIGQAQQAASHAVLDVPGFGKMSGKQFAKGIASEAAYLMPGVGAASHLLANPSESATQKLEDIATAALPFIPGGVEAAGLESAGRTALNMVGGAGLNLGIGELLSGGHLSPGQVQEEAIVGGLLGGAGMAAGAAASDLLGPVAGSLVGRAGLGGGISAGLTLPFTRNPAAVAENAILGGALGVLGAGFDWLRSGRGGGDDWFSQYVRAMKPTTEGADLSMELFGPPGSSGFGGEDLLTGDFEHAASRGGSWSARPWAPRLESDIALDEPKPVVGGSGGQGLLGVLEESPSVLEGVVEEPTLDLERETVVEREAAEKTAPWEEPGKYETPAELFSKQEEPLTTAWLGGLRRRGRLQVSPAVELFTPAYPPGVSFERRPQFQFGLQQSGQLQLGRLDERGGLGQLGVGQFGVGLLKTPVLGQPTASLTSETQVQTPLFSLLETASSVTRSRALTTLELGWPLAYPTPSRLKRPGQTRVPTSTFPPIAGVVYGKPEGLLDFGYREIPHSINPDPLRLGTWLFSDPGNIARRSSGFRTTGGVGRRSSAFREGLSFADPFDAFRVSGHAERQDHGFRQRTHGVRRQGRGFKPAARGVERRSYGFPIEAPPRPSAPKGRVKTSGRKQKGRRPRKQKGRRPYDPLSVFGV